MNKTPMRTHRDRTVRSTSHKIAHASQSQIVGCNVHAKWWTAKKSFTFYLGQTVQQPQANCQTNKTTSPMHAIEYGDRIPHQGRPWQRVVCLISHLREKKSHSPVTADSS